MVNTRVLIVGAGPTGLTLALSLGRRGVPFRLISEADGPGEHSRAMVVQARTLEFYDQFGFADEVVRQGIPAGMAHLRAPSPVDGAIRERNLARVGGSLQTEASTGSGSRPIY